MERFKSPLAVVSLVTGRTEIADVAVRPGGGARRAEVVAGNFERAAALPAGVGPPGAGVSVVAGSAGFALAARRVVQAGAARGQIVRVARGGVAVTLAGDALELAAARAVPPDVAERALLARQARVPRRADALFNPSGSLRHRSALRSVPELGIVQSMKQEFVVKQEKWDKLTRINSQSFNLIGMKLGSNHQAPQIVQNEHELRFRHGVAFVLGASPPNDVLHALRDVVPVPRLPQRPRDGGVAVAVRPVAVADLHAGALHDDVGAARRPPGRVAARLHPRHVEPDRLGVRGELLARVLLRREPVVALEVGHVVVRDRQPVFVVERWRHDATPEQVGDQPAFLRVDLRLN